MNLKEKVNRFLKNESVNSSKGNLKKMIVIYGPTASGKTSLSIDIAKLLNTEIISTDSRQIYRGLDIGTGKILKNDMKGIKHHMLDIITPDKDFSVGEFKLLAESKIEEIFLKGKIPILCGGTGLYIDSLIYDFNIPKVPADEKIRKKFENEAELFGNEYVYNKLVESDPEYAKELHYNNIRYVIRGLEVKMLTGKSKMNFREEKILKYDILFLTPYDGNRQQLYKNIDLRVKQMFDESLIDEVKMLLRTYNKADFGMKTIGYKEVIQFLESEKNILDTGVLNNVIKGKKGGTLSIGEKVKLSVNLNLEETIELVQKNNRNYAKKQLTWFRKYEPDKNI